MRSMGSIWQAILRGLADIEAELPDEIRHAFGIHIDTHHRIAGQLQQSRHVAGSRSDLQNLARRSQGRDQLNIRQVSSLVVEEVVDMPSASRAGLGFDGRPQDFDWSDVQDSPVTCY